MPNGLAGSAQVSYPLLAPSGTAGAPSYSFAGYPDNGWYMAASNSPALSVQGISVLRAAWNFLWIPSDTIPFLLGAAQDVALYRDAAGVLAQKNGANAQEFRVYGTTTGPKYLSIGHDGTQGLINCFGAGNLYLEAGGVGWGIEIGSGVMFPTAAGTHDLGFSVNRIRRIFLGGNTPAASAPMLDLAQTWNDVAQIFIGAKISITNTNSAPGSYSFATYGGAAGLTFAFGIEPSGYGVSAAGFQGPEWRFASNGRFYAPSDGVWVCYNNASSDFTRLCFGGTSVLFPAIKRDGANLALVPADGSAGYIDLTCHDVIGSSVYLSNLVGVGANNTNIGLSLTGFAMNIHNSSAALTIAVTGGATLAKFAGTGYLEMYEVTAPSAPAANTGRIYFEDNGAGKTRLMCLFGSGAAQQIAIEP